MHCARVRFFASATLLDSLIFPRAGCVALAILLSGCSLGSVTQRVFPMMEKATTETRYSLIYVIHGDGDYLYHDEAGRAFQADREALARAVEVAEQNPSAEVFIFHERSRRRFLGLRLPGRDGRLLFYRGGRLEAEAEYRRDPGAARFDPVEELYRRFSTPGDSIPTRAFLYFGHEIPEFGGIGYDRSYRNSSFTVDDLAAGLGRLTTDSTRFDLVVLSTCYGGTPYTVRALAPYSHTIVASPETLHLGYFDQGAFERLDVTWPVGETTRFARQFAGQAFERLANAVETVVSVAVYDIDRLRGSLSALDPDRFRYPSDGEYPPFSKSTRFDCADDPASAISDLQDGVDVLFRPAQFGRQQSKSSHSGWQCRTIFK